MRWWLCFGCVCLSFGLAYAQDRPLPDRKRIETVEEKIKQPLWKQWFGTKEATMEEPQEIPAQKIAEREPVFDKPMKIEPKESFLSRAWNRVIGKAQPAPKDSRSDGTRKNIQERETIAPESTESNSPGIRLPVVPPRSVKSPVEASTQDQVQSELNLNDMIDTDGDTFLDAVDLCPRTPGSANGCPDFSVYTPRSGQKDVTLRRLNQTEYDYEEFDQIRLGDIFQLQVIDPLTDKVIMTSDPYVVTD